MKQPSQEDLLGYMLGALDAREHEQVQQLIDQDPQLEEKLLSIKASLAPLELVDEHLGPPPGLARRCCQFIAASSRLPGCCLSEALPARRAIAESETGETAFRSHAVKFSDEERKLAPLSRRSVWDFVFACTAAMLVGAILLPAISMARFNSKVFACQNNLRSIYNSMVAYADAHGGYPDIPRTGNLSNVGSFAIELKDAGWIVDDTLFSCPASPASEQSGASIHIPTKAEIKACNCPQQLLALQQRASGDYGYTLGYFEGDRYHSASDISRTNLVILADAPSSASPKWSSSNHGGYGQNVLLGNGAWRFNRTATIGADAIFVSDRNIVEPGLHPDDSVVAASHIRAFPTTQAEQ